jgi:hypothetical protein
MKLTIRAQALTGLSPEAVFDRITGPSGLGWIESPWSLIRNDDISEGSILVWSLGSRRRVETRAHLVRPTPVSWTGGGLEGKIEIDAAADGRTQVKWTGVFPMPIGGFADLLMGLFMQGKMSRMASEASESRLARALT